MKDKINAYLDEVCEQIKEKSVHSSIRDELSGHIYELAKSFEKDGLAPDEAIDAAVLAMGSAKDTGRELNRQHRPKIEWPLILLTAALAALGLFINRSLTTVPQRLVVVSLTLAALLVPMLTGYVKLKKLSLPLYFVLSAAFIVTAAACPHIGSMSVTAAFCVQLLIPLFAGVALQIRKNGEAADAVKLTGLMALALAAAAATSRMSYFLVYVLTFAVITALLMAEGYFAKKRFALICFAGLGAIMGIGFFAGARGMRLNSMIRAFISRGEWMPEAEGYISNNLFNILRSAPMIGGVNDYSSKVVNNVSELTLASIIGSLGYLAAAGIVAVVLALLVRLVMVSVRAKGKYGRLLSLCCCSLLLAKFSVNILMNFGLLPVMGVTLPLIGHGGADCVLTGLTIGLVLSVYRRNDLFPEAAPENN